MNELKQYFSVKEIAEKMNIKPCMIYSLIKKGLLPCVHVGNKYLIEVDEMQKCFHSLKMN